MKQYGCSRFMGKEEEMKYQNLAMTKKNGIQKKNVNSKKKKNGNTNQNVQNTDVDVNHNVLNMDVEVDHNVQNMDVK